MILTKIKTSTFFVIKYTREHWTEWFTMFYALHIVEEWACRPRFYLPVQRDETRNGYQCWILPLAPFVMLWLIVFRVFIATWKDLMDLAKILKQTK